MIEHNGKEIPCNSENTVLVRFRNKGVTVGKASKYVWNWHKAPYHSDVIEYKVLY